MRIFITGGTGLIGKLLVYTLVSHGHEVTVFSRNVEKARSIFGNKAEYCFSLDSLHTLDGYNAVINLAGESIGDKRWTRKQKIRIGESRWGITQKIAELIRCSKKPPQVLISGSAIGYYGSQGDGVLIESSQSHDEFTHQVCKKWEDYALAAQSDATRVCLLRTGIVLSSEGGMLPKIALPFRFGLGSILGSGKQYLSWIHRKDMVNIIIFLLNTPEAQGPFNAVAPSPITNRDFSKILAKSLHRPCLFKLPSFFVSLIMGERASLVLGSQRAIPLNLEKIGFKHEFPTLKDALSDIFK